MVTTWNATTSGSPTSCDRKKSARHSRRSRRWRGKVERQRSLPDFGSRMIRSSSLETAGK
jgi:hypothetical protein